MQYLSHEALAQTPLQVDPFEYVVVPNFVKPERLAEIAADFPDVPGAGSHPPSELRIAGHFAGLLEDLQSEEFRHAIESKFGIDLEGRPTMMTVRGFVRKRTERSTRTARRKSSPSCSI